MWWSIAHAGRDGDGTAVISVTLLPWPCQGLTNLIKKFFSVNRAGDSFWCLDCHKIYPNTIINSEMNNTSTIASFTNTSSSTTMHLPSQTEEIAICSAIVIEAVLIAGGNSLTIFLFVLEKKLRKKSLLLFINMAFADVMLGAVSLPLYIYLRVGLRPPPWRKGVLEPLEVFFLWIDLIFLQASSMSAVFISCERFYAVSWPLKHLTLSTRAYAIVGFNLDTRFSCKCILQTS